MLATVHIVVDQRCWPPFTLLWINDAGHRSYCLWINDADYRSYYMDCARNLYERESARVRVLRF